MPRAAVALAALAAALAPGPAAPASPGEAVLVSRASGSDGDKGNGPSGAPSISASGRFVAFLSSANNLSAADRPRVRDVFVRDLRTGRTTLVSRATGRGGVGANRPSADPRISANGRYVAFHSGATNLSGADRERTVDVFVRDLRRARTILVSRANGRRGQAANAHATGPSISGDGRRVAFESPASNLTGADDDGAINRYDVFVRDVRRGRTELVSQASGRRGRAGSASAQAQISASGRFVAFDSGAALTREGNRAVLQVYVRDLRRKRTVLVSRASGRNGAPARGTASQPAISARGRYVAFESPSENLARGDRRGFDLFVRDLRRRRTTLASRRGRRGANAPPECYSISGDGRLVAFESRATNLSDEDARATVDVFVRDLRRRRTLLASLSNDPAGRPVDGDSGCPSLSRDGRLVAFESVGTNLSPLDDDERQDVFVRRLP